MPSATLILFAKYPTPGSVKTRLIPTLGAAGATRLAEAFLLDLTARLARECVREIELILCFDPPDSEAQFRALLGESTFVLKRFQFLPQSLGGLGERLACALAAIRETHSAPYLFLGTDAPDLPARLIAASLETAVKGTAALVPADDGGYVLLALPGQTPPGVFQNINWSSSETAAMQRARLAELKVPVSVSRERWPDVDQCEDLKGLRTRLRENPTLAPRTLAVLLSLAAGRWVSF